MASLRPLRPLRSCALLYFLCSSPQNGSPDSCLMVFPPANAGAGLEFTRLSTAGSGRWIRSSSEAKVNRCVRNTATSRGALVAGAQDASGSPAHFPPGKATVLTNPRTTVGPGRGHATARRREWQGCGLSAWRRARRRMGEAARADARMLDGGCCGRYGRRGGPDARVP